MSKKEALLSTDIQTWIKIGEINKRGRMAYMDLHISAKEMTAMLER